MDAQTVRMFCILGIVIVLCVPFALTEYESSQVISDILGHISCYELKKMTNSTHLQEKSYAQQEYGEKC